MIRTYSHRYRRSQVKTTSYFIPVFVAMGWLAFAAVLFLPEYINEIKRWL